MSRYLASTSLSVSADPPFYRDHCPTTIEKDCDRYICIGGDHDLGSDRLPSIPHADDPLPNGDIDN